LNNIFPLPEKKVDPFNSQNKLQKEWMAIRQENCSFELKTETVDTFISS